MEFFRISPDSYCWWTKSCTTKDDNYPVIYRVLTIPGGAGFRPSTVCCKYLHKGKWWIFWMSESYHLKICITSVTWKNIVDSFVTETPCWSSAYHGNHFPGIWLGSTLKNTSKNCFTLTLGCFFWGRVFWSIEPSRALFDVDASELYIFSSRRQCQGIARNLAETRNQWKKVQYLLVSSISIHTCHGQNKVLKCEMTYNSIQHEEPIHSRDDHSSVNYGTCKFSCFQFPKNIISKNNIKIPSSGAIKCWQT